MSFINFGVMPLLLQKVMLSGYADVLLLTNNLAIENNDKNLS